MRVNIANGDMVGHTGDIEATIVGCKAADEAVKVHAYYHLCNHIPIFLRFHSECCPVEDHPSLSLLRIKFSSFHF